MQPEIPNFHLLSKPAGAACNLSCQYCFFLSKENLYRNESFLMEDSVLENYIRQLMETSPGPEVQISWQGGEPMLRGIEFFKKSVEYANKYRRSDQEVLHTIQTNGTLVDDEWAEFFKQNNYLVGISIDGPRAMHDAYRVTKSNIGSFDDVVQGWNCLHKHDVDINVLCTVHAANVDSPLEVYRFFRDELKAKYIQMIPIVERATEETILAANQGWGGRKGIDRPLYKQEGHLVTERTVNSDKFGHFLISIFDEWVKRDVGSVHVTTFDVALGSWLGQHNLCIVAPTCGNALVLEHNGDVYSCDHFVEPDFYLGNIESTPLKTLITSEKQRQFGNHKFDSLPKYCKECPVLFACFGECPRNRFIKTPDGEEGLNYLCSGYRAFFTHIDKPMQTMGKLVAQGRYADEIMSEPSSAR